MLPFVLEALLMTVLGGLRRHAGLARPDRRHRRAAAEGRGVRHHGPAHVLAGDRRRHRDGAGHDRLAGRLLPRAPRRVRQPRGLPEVRVMMIEMQGIRKVYSTGRVEVEALKSIDLDIDRNEFVAIVGPSGSGKSTLMNLLGCLDTPTSGRLPPLRRDRRRPRPQPPRRDPQPPHRLRLPELQPAALRDRPRERRAAAALRRRAARRSGASGPRPCSRRWTSPTAWTTGRPSSRAARCSGWRSPAPSSTGRRSILADEPTGNLDSASGKGIVGLFQRAARGRPDDRDDHPRHGAREARLAHRADPRRPDRRRPDRRGLTETAAPPHSGRLRQ